jgi:pimeloyl-ACP methyl ester carboxylesterase
MGTTALAFEEHGPAGARPIILLHGSPVDRRMWMRQANELASAGYRAILPDLRGHGKSPPGDEDVTLSLLAKDVLALARRLELPHFVVGGLSVGGMVAAQLAIAHPGRIDGLLLAATRLDADSPDEHARRLSYADRLRREGLGADADAMLPRILTPETIASRPELAAQVRAMIVSTPLDARVQTLVAVTNRTDLRGRLGELKMPVLVIVGAEDAITPPSCAKDIHRRIAGAFLQEVVGASHLVNLEAPGVFNEAVLNWLAFAGLEP